MVDWFKLLIKATGAVTGVCGIALGLLYFLQEKIIYVPRLPGIPNDYPYLPDAFGMRYEDIWLTTADGLRLHAWLMWPPHWTREQRRSRPTVAFFQENAGNMAFRLPFLKQLTRVLDCNAFIFSYRGYGRSEGSPTEQGLRLDAEAAMQHLLRRTDIDPAWLILFGRSLGGAVAAHAAARFRPHVAGLILENTFTRVVDIVPHMLPFLRPLVGPGRLGNFLVRNRWDTKTQLQQLTDLPTLFLSSLQDEMLPAYQMRELYEVHPAGPWSIIYFEGGRHMDAYDTHAPWYWPAVQQFLTGLQPALPLPPEAEAAADAAAAAGKTAAGTAAGKAATAAESVAGPAAAAAAAAGRQQEEEQGELELADACMQQE